MSKTTITACWKSNN